VTFDKKEPGMRIQMRGLLLPVVVFVLLVGAGGAFAASSGDTVNAASSDALGTKIVVSAAGFTLYHLTSEKKASISCTGACRKAWPPLLVTGTAKPVAGAGVSAAKLGTIKRPDGGVQVTYNGFALYRYIGDTKPGQVNGQGVEGTWFAVTPAGAITRASASTSGAKAPANAPSQTTPATSTPSTTTPTPPAATTTAPASGGYDY
jgi:predicted lipoprotein with Yx(FWY)xxD motif